MSPKKIAVIEDEPDILEVIHYNLSKEGFRVVTSTDGDEGLEIVRKENPDMVLLDLLLPSVDGLELCRKLKLDPTTQDVPIIMVTAKGEESDVVLGLGMGADDYVTKPFSPKELMARIRAVLRRSQSGSNGTQAERVVWGGLVIDALRHVARVDGEPVRFTATEFRLLYFLASHPGRVFTREQLLSRAIAEGTTVIDRNIDVHVRSIRKKLGPYRRYIDTVRGVGYKFADEEE